MDELREEIPWHWLRANHSTRYPRRIICLDTEANVRRRKTGETHTFKLAAATYDLLDPETRDPVRSEQAVFFEPGELWEWIAARTKSKTRTIVWAHNLAYDLRISNALAELERLGWQRKFLAVDGVRTCARYQQGTRSIALADLASFLPATLADLSQRIGCPKLPMPDQSAPETDWATYCLRDVEGTRQLVLYLLRWLEDNGCGMFRLTGPAQAMAAFRHRFLRPGSMLVHKDEAALAAERTAAWAGRCEAYRHGDVPGPLYEWDFTLAYLTLARRLFLPVQLQAWRDDLSARQALRKCPHYRVLAEVEVEQDEPLLPADLDGGIAWPVGRFVTTVWDVELRAALDRGAEARLIRCWLYKPRPALASWADWLYELLEGGSLPSAAVERVMLKAWARSLVGRFGMRVPVWEEIGELDEPSLRYLPAIDADSGQQGAILELGRTQYERAGLVDSADAMPAVLSYIMAAARVRLLAAIETAGWPEVAYVDTDSLLVTREGHERLTKAKRYCRAEGLRLKGEHPRATILGPRQLVLGDELRVAGLPRSAIRQSATTFDAELWESLAGTLGRGKTGEVRVARRAIRLRGTDRRRKHVPGGLTAPLRVSGGAG